MWLSTPRFLFGLALVALLTLAVAWMEREGVLAHAQARLYYAAACLALLAAIVFRARARWRNWRDRQR